MTPEIGQLYSFTPPDCVALMFCRQAYPHGISGDIYREDTDRYSLREVSDYPAWVSIDHITEATPEEKALFKEILLTRCVK